MANITLKKKISGGTEEVYPKTTWAQVNNKPLTFSPASHAHGSITNDGKIGTDANKVLITGTGGLIGTTSGTNTQFLRGDGTWATIPTSATPLGKLNLNYITTEGVYHQGAHASGTIARNYPVDQTAGSLEVYKGVTGGVNQVFISSIDSVLNGMYFRTFNGTSWTTWRRVVTGNQVSLWAESTNSDRIPESKMPTNNVANTFLKVGTANTSPSFQPLSASDVPNISTSKLTSGTLGVVRGGTGKDSVTANSYLKGNGTGALIERTYAQVKTDLSLNNVENKSSATIRGEITSANVTTALGFTPYVEIVRLV